MGIKVRKNNVLVRLNEEIYCRECIEQAIKDFKDVCTVTENEDGLLLKPKAKIEPVRLGYEFSNYVLGLMKN